MIENVRDINRKYNGEWLVLTNTKNDEHGNLSEGEVLMHSTDKNAAFNYIGKNKLPVKSTTIRFGGHIRESFFVEM